jgi:hypothetical protein
LIFLPLAVVSVTHLVTKELFPCDEVEVMWAMLVVVVLIIELGVSVRKFLEREVKT